VPAAQRGTAFTARPGRSHAGVIFVSQRTVGDIGSLVRALAWIFREFGSADWTDRQDFLRYV
jgi:hypothetical protein